MFIEFHSNRYLNFGSKSPANQKSMLTEQFTHIPGNRKSTGGIIKCYEMVSSIILYNIHKAGKNSEILLFP